MRATENRNLIQRYFDTLTGKRTDHSVDSFMSENVVWYLPQVAPAIDPGPHIGRRAVMAFIEHVQEHFQPGTTNITLHKIIADDYDATVQLTLRAKLINGRYYKRQYYFAFSIRNGLIEGVHEHIGAEHSIS